MAIKFRKMQNKIGGSTGYGKWYPRLVQTGTVTTEQIAEEISHSSTLTFADVMGVLIELGEAMHRHLLDSQKVSLYRIGSFRVGIKSVPTVKKKDCTADCIKSYHIVYSPEISFTSTGISSKGFPTGFYTKDMLEGIEAKEMPNGNTTGHH